MMSILSSLVSAGLGATWLYHAAAAAIGMPKVPDIAGQEWDLRPLNAGADSEARPRVSIIVPARNEEAMIEEAVRSLLSTDYPNAEIIAVNDRSEDRTGEILDRVVEESRGKLKAVHVRHLPPGWLGKTHAMWAAAEQATGEWLVFTDADVIHHPDVLRRAVAYAKRECADHLVVLPTMVMKTWGERMMISFFQAMFIFAHRPWKVADPKAKDHIGVGAFNMVRRSAYDAIGGYDKLRLAIVDDMMLGERIKKLGFAQRNVFGRGLVRVRWAEGASGVVGNLTKNFFAQLRYSAVVAIFAALAILAIQLGPWVGMVLAQGLNKAGYAVALLCLLLVYAGMARRSGVSPGYVLLHPVATLLMVYTLLRSTALTLWQGGVVWRGTKYPLKELREANDSPLPNL